MPVTTGTKNKSSSGSSRSLVDAAGILFDAQSTNPISKEFEVKGCPLQLIAFDLADGDTIQVERVFELPGCEHVKRTVPITSCCGTCTQSVYRQGTRLVDTTWIQAEGRYRLVYSSGTVGTATVIMHEDPLAIHRDLDDCDSCECAVDLCSLISEQPDVGQAALGLD